MTDVPVGLFDLPDIIITQVLQHFATDPLNIVNFSFTCKAACKIAISSSLWSTFCKASLPPGLAEPSVWRAADAKHLWIALALPYGQLLGRLWHTNTWPSGQIIHVDAEPPRLVARSLYYKSLNGGPHCHDVFVVELQPGAPAKAVVTCWRDKHGADTFESPAELRAPPPPAAAGSRTAAGTAPSTASAAAAATGETTAAAAAAAAAAAPGAADTGAANAAGTVGTSITSPASSTSRSSIDPSCGFMLCCKGHCDSVVSEFTNRRLRARPYHVVRHAFTVIQQHQQQGRISNSAAAELASIGVSHAGSSSSSSSASDAHAQGVPPLPDVGAAPTIDFIHFISLSDMLPSFATPVFTPLSLDPWLRTGSSRAAAFAAAGSTGAAHGPPALAEPAPAGGSSSSMGSAAAGMQHPFPAAAAGGAVSAGGSCLDEASIAAALSLTGLWRGTYGSHGVELVQLQLLLAPPGYDMFEPGGSISRPALLGAAALVADNTAESQAGVLLQGLAGLVGADGAAVGGSGNAGIAAAAAAAAAGAGQGEQEAGAAVGEDTGIVVQNGDGGGMQMEGIGAGGGEIAGQGQAGASQQAAEQGAAAAAAAAVEAAPAAAAASAGAGVPSQQQQQLLLVATKLTGDMNVPVACVTFAVDVGSRCSVGAGRPLALLPGTDSDVALNRLGTRQLLVQERYRGRAQIAFTSFQAPHIIAAELVVFGCDCFGLLWKRPVESFSLFSRVDQLLGAEEQ